MADINQVQLPDGSQYNIKDDTSGYASETYVQNQISGITKATIGLGNVDNTSDANKPVSTAQQTALNGKTNTSVIAYTESSTTATKRYEIGDQFILNGVLYTATAIIANGGTITVGTNCSASDTIVEQIPNVDLKADKTDLTSISETGSTASQAISAGTYFYLNGTLVRAKVDIASGATFTEGTNYETFSNGGINGLKSELTKNALKARVNIDSYYSTSNLYTFPQDGYVEILPQDNAKTGVIYVFGSGGSSSTAVAHISSSGGEYISLFVRKGMKCYCTGNATHYFIGLN